MYAPYSLNCTRTGGTIGEMRIELYCILLSWSKVCIMASTDEGTLVAKSDSDMMS